jgi:hypothetical protein
VGGGLSRYRERKSLTSLIITALIILMLIFSGPAGAVSVSLAGVSDLNQGQYLTFDLDVSLDKSYERIPIQNITIIVTNASTGALIGNYSFAVDGTAMSSGIKASQTVNQLSYGYGYGYGYYGGTNYSFGYGYGYGYGTGLHKFSYFINITDSINYSPGNYTIKALVNTGSTTIASFNSSAANFTIVSGVTVDVTPPNVNITSPPDGATLGIVNNTITGRVTDNVGIAVINLTVNGALQHTWTSAGTFSKKVNYTADQLNTINITAKDTSGNIKSKSITVNVTSPVVVTEVTVTNNTVATVDASTETSVVINFTTNVTSAAANVTIEAATNASALNSSSISQLGVVDIGKYISISVEGQNISETQNISWVYIKVDYADPADLDRNGDGDANDVGTDVDESTLRIYRNTSGSWVKLDCSSLGGCPATLDDGAIVYDAGVNTVKNFVYANLSHFSVYSLGGGTITAAVKEAVGAGPSPLEKGIKKISTTTKDILNLVSRFFYYTKQFFVAPAELAGTLGSLGYITTTSANVAELNKELVTPVKTLKGDPYEIASEEVLKNYRVASKVVIARGDLSVDSLSAVAYAKALNAPLLLVKPEELPSITEKSLTKLHTTSTVIIGGPVAVSENVEKKLPKASRIWGKDRYETAVKVAEALMSQEKVDTIVVTDGLNPEVHAVILAIFHKAPIVYVSGDEVPAVTKDFLQKHTIDGTKRILIIGLSNKAEEAVKKIGS